jgi:hypothetical protein
MKVWLCLIFGNILAYKFWKVLKFEFFSSVWWDPTCTCTPSYTMFGTVSLLAFNSTVEWIRRKFHCKREEAPRLRAPVKMTKLAFQPRLGFQALWVVSAMLCGRIERKKTTEKHKIVFKGKTFYPKVCILLHFNCQMSHNWR